MLSAKILTYWTFNPVELTSLIFSSIIKTNWGRQTGDIIITFDFWSSCPTQVWNLRSYNVYGGPASGMYRSIRSPISIVPDPAHSFRGCGGYALITSCLFILAGPAAEALFQLRLSTPLMWFSCILECRGWITGKSPVARLREWVCRIENGRVTKCRQRHRKWLTRFNVRLEKYILKLIKITLNWSQFVAQMWK